MVVGYDKTAAFWVCAQWSRGSLALSLAVAAVLSSVLNVKTL